MIIDSYAHVSRKKYSPVEMFLPALDDAGVEHAVLVQPLEDYDNSYLLECSSRFPRRFTAIALPNLGLASAASMVERLVGSEGFAGIRATSAVFGQRLILEQLARADAVLLLHLPDGIGLYREELTAVAGQFQSLRIYIPHLGWPRSAGAATPGWQEAVRDLSCLSNVAIGISALCYFSDEPFPHRDVWETVAFVIESFRGHRCLWASDFPLLLNACRYVDYLRLFQQDIPGISTANRELVLDAAASFWRISK